MAITCSTQLHSVVSSKLQPTQHTPLLDRIQVCSYAINLALHMYVLVTPVSHVVDQTGKRGTGKRRKKKYDKL